MVSNEKTARAILKKIKKGNAFISLVEKYSESDDKRFGGDIGQIGPEELVRKHHVLIAHDRAGEGQGHLTAGAPGLIELDEGTDRRQ